MDSKNIAFIAIISVAVLFSTSAFAHYMENGKSASNSNSMMMSRHGGINSMSNGDMLNMHNTMHGTNINQVELEKLHKTMHGKTKAMSCGSGMAGMRA